MSLWFKSNIKVTDLRQLAERLSIQSNELWLIKVSNKVFWQDSLGSSTFSFYESFQCFYQAEEDQVKHPWLHVLLFYSQLLDFVSACCLEFNLFSHTQTVKSKVVCCQLYNGESFSKSFSFPEMSKQNKYQLLDMSLVLKDSVCWNSFYKVSAGWCATELKDHSPIYSLGADCHSMSRRQSWLRRTSALPCQWWYSDSTSRRCCDRSLSGPGSDSVGLWVLSAAGGAETQTVRIDF